MTLFTVKKKGKIRICCCFMLDTNCRYIPIVAHATHQVTPIFLKMIHSKGKTFEGKITFSAGKINWSNVLQNKTCYLAAILKLSLLTGPYQRRRHWGQGSDETLEKMRFCSLLPCCWIHVTLRLHLNIAEEKAKFTGVLIFCKDFYSSAMRAWSSAVSTGHPAQCAGVNSRCWSMDPLYEDCSLLSLLKGLSRE